ncbi:GNAT family N-acetyltransferase [Companilactobacillus ginsenosidimutans]|uniref:GNAT family acetyltransferase n=1 Tax=Companilactobacillus ginsenosidimutans TaxID=1007676 RepID=A0A0H4QK41_9LACO|nr:GNAT family N-acetyltransferase [Companilactobacillus ginsenosidimutans]AKP67411.1 GNAT family acetyltransferase [Companilactobacillus ginsenosidimutans]
MEIIPYKTNPKHLAGIIDVINYGQNIEADLKIKMVEEYDLFDIENSYQARGGEFWIALDNDRVVGTIALYPLIGKTAVLKKLFSYPEYRGDPIRIGNKLYDKFMEFAKAHGYTKIILDSPEGRDRAHHFYEKKGFNQITAEQLEVEYHYPDRNSLLYESNI